MLIAFNCCANQITQTHPLGFFFFFKFLITGMLSNISVHTGGRKWGGQGSKDLCGSRLEIVQWAAWSAEIAALFTLWGAETAEQARGAETNCSCMQVRHFSFHKFALCYSPVLPLKMMYVALCKTHAHKVKIHGIEFSQFKCWWNTGNPLN